VEINAEVEKLVASAADAGTAKPWKDMVDDEVEELLLCFYGRHHRWRPVCSAAEAVEALARRRLWQGVYGDWERA
jgi:hypothetical protein